MKIILFNGPPRSGKNTSADMMCKHLHIKYDVYLHNFADPLKASVHALFGQSPEPRSFEYVKDVPIAEFGMRTPRSLYIKLSEEFVKPNFGKKHFAKAAISVLRQLEQTRDGKKPLVVAMPDCGFQIEIDEFLSEFREDNMALVKMTRLGCSFNDDSRNYVNFIDDRTFTIPNDGPLESLSVQCKATANAILTRWGLDVA